MVSKSDSGYSMCVVSVTKNVVMLCLSGELVSADTVSGPYLYTVQESTGGD